MPVSSRPNGGIVRVLALASVGVLAASLAARLLAANPPVWDDAYMFFRYAANLAREGALVWNPGGPPTWGATSLLYVFLVLAVRTVVADPLRALLTTSLACGVALIVLLARVARVAGGDALGRGGAAVFALFLVAFQARPLTAHFLSGMDTTFAAAWLALYILLAYRQQRTGKAVDALLLGIVGGLAFVVRPELLLFSVAVPAAVLARVHGREGRRGALLAAGTTAAVALCLAGAAAAYFGRPLPLPFYVKQAGFYGETMRQALAGVGVHEWWVFALSNAPALALSVWTVLRWRRAGRRSEVALEAGLLCGVLAYGVYHAFFVMPIMHYEQRFHYPVLAALVALGARGWVELRARHPGWAPAAAACALVVLTWPAARRAVEIEAGLHAGGAGAPLTVEDSYRAWEDTWFGLDRLGKLPDDAVIATTEVGLPAMMCARQTILDLSGLNDARVARGGLSPERIFEGRPPDWIYIPQDDYREYVQALKATPFFKARYEVHEADRLGTAMVRAWGRTEPKPYFLGVAILRDGPHTAACRAILDGARGR